MAARSTDGRRFPWGDDTVKWSRTRAFRQIDPKMAFSEDRSPYNVYDMAGNVEEWTRDWFEYKYYLQFTKKIADNPTGPATNGRSRTPQRVARGGARNWSITAREPMPVDKRLPYLGFRCALVVEDAGPAPAPVAVSPAAQPGAAPVATPTKPAPPPF
jgi:formylglycine-generating enzyme required for sulfatase activity